MARVGVGLVLGERSYPTTIVRPGDLYPTSTDLGLFNGGIDLKGGNGLVLEVGGLWSTNKTSFEVNGAGDVLRISSGGAEVGVWKEDSLGRRVVFRYGIGATYVESTCGLQGSGAVDESMSIDRTINARVGFGLRLLGPLIVAGWLEEGWRSSSADDPTYGYQFKARGLSRGYGLTLEWMIRMPTQGP